MFELVSKYTPSGDQPQAIKELVQGIKDGIVSLEMCQKWSDLNYMIPIVEYNLGVLAEEVYFCEIIAYDNNLEKYYLVSYDVVKEDKYHFRLIEKGRREIYED